MRANPPLGTPLDALVEQYGGQIYALALRFCGTPDEAEDLVQDVFLHAHRAWADFHGDSDPKT